MPTSYCQLFYHFVWTTKQRAEVISLAIRAHLLNYMREKTEELKGRVHALEAVADHVHLLVSLPPNLAPADFIANLKGASSHFVNQVLLKEKSFYWQEGYGVLSLSNRDLARVTQYVDRQEEHHRGQELWPSLEKTEEPTARG